MGSVFSRPEGWAATCENMHCDEYALLTTAWIIRDVTADHRSKFGIDSVLGDVEYT